MIDTHCHLTYEGLIERVDAVLAAAHEAGVDRMISIGTTPDDARNALALAHQHPSVYASVGVHPHYAARCTDRDAVMAVMRELADDPRIVALGEFGLDQHYPDPPLKLQQQVLDWQLEVMASRPDLPGVVHNREATSLTLEALRRSGIDPGRFVFHCFTGSQDELESVLAFGARVSFTGIVTFPGARAVAQAAATVPIERLMIETDAPYLTPEPYRKVRPNEPRYVVEVARFLAAQRGMTLDAFAAQMDANAQAFFRFP